MAVSITKKSETAKVAEVPTKVMEVTSSDEEFLEATITLERDEERNTKEKADSDDEFLQAAMELENIQVENANADMGEADKRVPNKEKNTSMTILTKKKESQKPREHPTLSSPQG